MSLFKQKMTELGYKPLFKSDAASFDVGKALSDLAGFPIPADYLAFLAEYPVSGVFGLSVNCLGITPSPVSPDCYYDISCIFAYSENTFKNVIELRKSHFETWDFGLEYLVIGRNTFGNYFCLKLLGDNAGGVYYWEHDPAEDEECMFLLASSFTDFIERLCEEPEDEAPPARQAGPGLMGLLRKIFS